MVFSAIPVTLALTLATFYLCGFTLNRITLFALIFSIGILVDDTIVIVENVVRHARMPQNLGRTLAQVAVEAVDEVGYPHRDELTFVSHTVRGRQASRVSLRADETVVMLVCRAELIGTDRLRQGGPRPALREAYAEMGWEVPELLDAMDASDDLYFDRASQINLPQWSGNGVALIGRLPLTARWGRHRPRDARGVCPGGRTPSSRRQL